MSGKNLKFSSEKYGEHLIRLKLRPSRAATIPDSIITLPKIYTEDHKDKTHAMWTLERLDDSKIKGDCVAKVVIIQNKTWGEHPWQWQSCISAGGIISVLSNTRKSETDPPIIDEEYKLCVSFL